MKLAIDASRLLTTKPTGVELYTQKIIEGLLKYNKSILLYTPQKLKNISSLSQKVLHWPIIKFWSQIRLSFELLFYPPDIFFSPSYVIPFLALLNKQIKYVVTIHDVAFIKLPHSYSFFTRYFLSLTTHQSIKHATSIIVPTQSTKDDLIKYFNCPPHKIIVTHFGYQPLPQKLISSTIKKQQILYLGRLEDKKNIDNLVQAFKIFKQAYPEYKLILAGKKGVGFKQDWLADPSIKYVGYINNSQKNILLQESACLAFVSKYEGFGFPLLEAFSHRLPVLASNIPVLKEIGGQACLFVSPSSSVDIAQGLKRIISDQSLTQSLINHGTKRLDDFSWQHCIDKTYNILYQ